MSTVLVALPMVLGITCMYVGSVLVLCNCLVKKVCQCINFFVKKAHQEKFWQIASTAAAKDHGQSRPPGEQTGQ